MTHITENNIEAICGDDAEISNLVTMEEALDPAGKHFDCPNCHKKLTGGRRHSEPS